MAPKAVVTLGSTDFEMTAQVRQHTVIVDEPIESGGQDKGPEPNEYLCVALASCTTATIKMYLNHKQIKIDKLSVEVIKETTEDKKNIFKRNITIEGSFDAAMREHILAIANKCPIHKILEAANTIETKLA
ncbi:MAG TPA: OsmC family protein [Bacteroidia bacterium]|nr:OsmC family protein [Bacteroidia bacterium]